jgi:hypothetical protein
MVIDKNKWRTMFEKREELQITREEYINGFQYFLQMELVKYQLENRPEILKYLEKEIQRLNETFKEN